MDGRMYSVERPLDDSNQVYTFHRFLIMLLIQVCLDNSPVFLNSSGKFCFARDPVGNFYSKLSCANLPNIIIIIIQLLEYVIPPPAPPPAPSPKKTHVMVLARVMVLACIMVLQGDPSNCVF